MASLAAQYENVSVKRIDIVDWDSDAWKQVQQKYGVRSIPYLRIYSPTGEFLGAVSTGSISEVEKRIASQARRKTSP